MEKEEEEDNIFTPWTSVYEDQEPAEGDEEEGEERGEEEEGETEEQAQRKSSVDIPRPSRASTTRRASLPCLTQLHAMNLSHLHSSTMAPSPAHLKHRTQSDARPYQRSRQRSLNEEGSGASTPSAISQRRPSAIPTIPEGIETLERRIRFRSRNVMSMSDADSICLICHDDLRKGGGGVRELHCTHSFHSECIEEWLWTKQSCPTCRVHIAMPEPLYWTSTRVKVP